MGGAKPLKISTNVYRNCFSIIHTLRIPLLKHVRFSEPHSQARQKNLGEEAFTEIDTTVKNSNVDKKWRLDLSGDTRTKK